MRQHWFLIFLLSFAFILQVNAQISTPPKGKKVDAQQKDQNQIDDQLAGQFFREHEYEKARDLYANLYKKNGQIYHFQQYTECLIQLKDFDQAEKELKAFSKKNPSHSKSIADLVYVYTLQGRNDKAEKRLNEALKELPSNTSAIRGLSNAFQARGLYSMAATILDKGNKLLNGEENFYLDLAYLNQSMVNYQEAFRYYFLELETHPGQYNNIRNRLQTLLFYDVNNSIADELRIALLQQTQAKPDNLEFAQLLVWFALQQEDYDIALAQSQSIDRRTHDQDAQINNLAGICLNNKQFDVAREGYSYIVNKGKSGPYYGQALTGMIKTDYQKLKSANSQDTKAFEKLTKRIDEAYNDINSNDLTKLTLIQADILSYQLDQSAEAVALLTRTIETVGGKQDKGELKLKLADIYLHEDEVWEATLLYSQVDKSLKEEPLGHEARFKNAQLR